MKKYIVLALSLFSLSCNDNIWEKEQYKKELYLVGASEKVYTTSVPYSSQEVVTYFTVSTSGTLPLDKNVTFKFKVNDELVDLYNEKELTLVNEDKYLLHLPKDLYIIPQEGKEVVLNHKNGISMDLPIHLITEGLKVDKSYVIPIELEYSDPYLISESGKKVLVKLDLYNEFSGDYSSTGEFSDDSSSGIIKKNKFLKATGINTVRMFYGLNNDDTDEDYVNKYALQLRINNEKDNNGNLKVDIQAWNSQNIILEDTGESFYNIESRKFYIKYKIGSKTYEETLEPIVDY